MLGTTAEVKARATGGTTYDVGGYRYHKFLAAGNLIGVMPGMVEVLLVAGGGGANTGQSTTATGGGGGGGTFVSKFYMNVKTYAVLIGAGGTGGTATNGGNTSIGGSTANVVLFPNRTTSQLLAVAVGGGEGGSYNSNGANGGCGGGSGMRATGGNPQAGICNATYLANSFATTTDQGFDGMQGSGPTGGYSGAGGGSAEAGGTSGSWTGGYGKLLTDWASATASGDTNRYGAGGAGKRASVATVYPGGVGGGGDSEVAGLVNTGGGAGGTDSTTGKAGGSGILIVRYRL